MTLQFLPTTVLIRGINSREFNQTVKKVAFSDSVKSKAIQIANFLPTSRCNRSTRRIAPRWTPENSSSQSPWEEGASTASEGARNKWLRSLSRFLSWSTHQSCGDRLRQPSPRICRWVTTLTTSQHSPGQTTLPSLITCLPTWICNRWTLSLKVRALMLYMYPSATNTIGLINTRTSPVLWNK